MRIGLGLILLFCPSIAFAQIAVPKSESPDGHFVVMMETDKDQKGYVLDTTPAMWIEEVKTKKKLADFSFGADPSSDAQPLRTHAKVLWNADGDAVVVQFQSRFYSHLVVFRLKGSLATPESFIKGKMPEDGEIIRRMVPRFKEFRSRWFQHPEGWIDQHTLLFVSGAGAILNPTTNAKPDEDINFMASYRFYVDYHDPETPVIKRIEHVGE